jgi:NADH:ubiquinone oxidoreductase subunit 4 (subunit M)
VLSISAYTDLNRKEVALFVPLVTTLFVRGLKPHLFLDVFFVDSINILEHARLGRRLNIIFLYLQNDTYFYYK